VAGDGGDKEGDGGEQKQEPDGRIRGRSGLPTERQPRVARGVQRDKGREYPGEK